MKLRYPTFELAESSAARRFEAVLPGDVAVWKQLRGALLSAALLAVSTLLGAAVFVYGTAVLANGVLALVAAWVGGVAVVAIAPVAAVRGVVWLLTRRRR